MRLGFSHLTYDYILIAIIDLIMSVWLPFISLMINEVPVCYCLYILICYGQISIFKVVGVCEYPNADNRVISHSPHPIWEIKKKNIYDVNRQTHRE